MKRPPLIVTSVCLALPFLGIASMETGPVKAPTSASAAQSETYVGQNAPTAMVRAPEPVAVASISPRDCKRHAKVEPMPKRQSVLDDMAALNAAALKRANDRLKNIAKCL